MSAVTMPAAARTRIGTALSVAWFVLLAMLPIGHLTGLRNTWTVAVVVATLAWVRGDAWRGLPARWTLVALLGWCAATIGWSTEPAISFAKWRGDLLLPLLCYAAAYGFARRSGSIAAIAGGLVAGLVLLAAVSAFVLVPLHDPLGLRDAIRTEAFPNVALPMPIYYPGVGDASMAASLAAGLLLFARRLAASIGRLAWIGGWVALAAIVVVANNRNAEIGIPVVAIACLWLTRNRRDPRTGGRPSRATVVRRASACALLLGLLIAVGVQLESGARSRLVALQLPVDPGRSAFVQLTARDTRPMIWTYYARLAMEAPLAGVGFGRTVPGLHYRTQDDRDLAVVESNAYSHAHNLFLNWWLQTGLIGVLLLIAALVEIVGHALRGHRVPGTAAVRRTAGFAVVAIVALMLIRNATDDFLVFGMATLFWTLLGALAGLGHRHVPDVALSAPRVP